MRAMTLSANRQPAAAFYLRRPGERQHQLVSVDVLRIDDERIVEISSFLDPLIRVFDLPPTL